MSVYVDDRCVEATVRQLTANWSHLLADSTDELLAFAERLGLQARWLEKPGTPHEHFDVTDRMRGYALRLGARPLSYPMGTGIYVAAKRTRMLADATVGDVDRGPERAPAAPRSIQPLPPSTVESRPVKERPRARWNPMKPQHSWIKLRMHWCRCWHCNIVRENVWSGDLNRWTVCWRWPDNTVAEFISTPSCPGPEQDGPTS